MKIKGYVLLALFLSFLPILNDPFYHTEKVNFWVWDSREIEEQYSGERM